MFTGKYLVAIRGGGDLGSGIALRLWRAGFPVVVLETELPIAVRRTVSLSEAVYDGSTTVEEMIGEKIGEPGAASGRIQRGVVPIFVDPDATSLPTYQPAAVIDAILAKRNVGTTRSMAPLVVGLGPGFEAGEDVHAVVETNRGPNLGRVYWRGHAEPNTHQPGSVGGHTHDRVLRAPIDGSLRVIRDIGSIVYEGDTVACVGEKAVRAPFRGLIRGMARDGLPLRAGMKMGDLDPRLDPTLCALVSDKALSVAGGVLEALLVHLRQNEP
jgi:xanthine dehydrogenase accessory factor